MTVTNSSLNTKDVVAQCKHETTHMHCEEYRETRAQKNIQYYEILLCQESSNTFILSVIILRSNQLKLKSERCFSVILDKIDSHNIECFSELLSLCILHNAYE